MNFAAIKYLNRFGPRTLRSFHNSIRRSTTEPPKSQDPCGCEPTPPAPPEPCPPKAAAPEPKIEPCPPPQPPPCPPLPQCPPTICPPIPDPNNPCNYCPPPCIDPDLPDLTRLKKYQCKFQEQDGVPVYLKRGNIDAFFYQLALVLTLLTCGVTIYNTIKIGTK